MTSRRVGERCSDAPRRSGSRASRFSRHGQPHRSPLHDRHVALGAKLAPFGGWEMPLSYAGTVEEHNAVRNDVGVFDVSHLGKGRVSGRRAREFVNASLTNDLGRIEPGEAQYTLCCDETGGVVDDLIAYLHSDDDVFLIPNAANTAEVVQRLAAAAPAGIEVTRPAPLAGRPRRAGPAQPGGARRRSACPPAAATCPSSRRSGRASRSSSAAPVTPASAATSCCRGGTTPASCGTRCSRPGAVPCGLGARDTLRTEMGYPLHGQDLSLEITPGAGAARLGGRLGQAALLGPGRAAAASARRGRAVGCGG